MGVLVCDRERKRDRDRERKREADRQTKRFLFLVLFL